jgi:glycosyltransferase involved in cell wall biosynthesis
MFSAQGGGMYSRPKVSGRKRLKVFLSAYACEPEKGSEPGIGWNTALLLSKHNDVHVLTRSNNREAIETVVPPGANPSLTFHYYDLPRGVSFWKKKRRGYRFYYYLWQYGAFLRYCRFVNQGGFDIIHHLTFANFAMPAPFVFCRPVTIWGPVRQLSTPRALFRAMPLRVRIKERMRQAIMWLMIHAEPGRVLTGRWADWILETPACGGDSSLPAAHRHKVISHPQTGINTSEDAYNLPSKSKGRDRVRLIICSEFVHWKGVIFSAEVFARLAVRRHDIELVVCGYGPEEEEMKRIFDRCGIADRVTFKGFLGKRDMLVALKESDILLYPSYHHGLATVILQAMYVGLPIVALHGDAVASTVADECGVAADGDDIEQILKNLESVTEHLIDDPSLRATLGARGSEMIRTTYEWERMVERLDLIYQTLAQRASVFRAPVA